MVEDVTKYAIMNKITKMFVKIKPADMVVGVKYASTSRHDSFTYFTGTFQEHISGIAQQFHYLKPHYYIENISMYSKLHSMNDPVSYYAFVPQKEKIQQAMEQRALDKILKRLINDDFTW